MTKRITMNNKLLSWVLVLGIAATGFTGLSSADDTNIWTTLFPNSEIRELIQKARTGEVLTDDEAVLVETAKAGRGERQGAKHGKRMGLSFLSDEEKVSLESMTDEEKTTFLEAKKEERKAEHEAQEAIITKLFNGEPITDAERATLEAKQAEHAEKSDGKTKNGKGAEGKAIIEKLIAGEALTEDEQTSLEEIKAKKEEREAQRVILEPIMEKKKAGETLTEDEQAILD